MSSVAAWYITRILEEAPPPPNAIPPQHRERGHAVAFKTGTSYGFRDAWAIGFDAAFTVGVWIGRPDGTFSPGRIGREAAAPVLYDIFDLLPTSARRERHRQSGAPGGGASGHQRGAACRASAFRGARQFRQGGSLADMDMPRIAFPVDGATLQLSAPAAAISRCRW